MLKQRSCASSSAAASARASQSRAAPPIRRAPRGRCRATSSSDQPAEPLEQQQQQQQQPWSLVNYYTKKLERRTDNLGRLAQDPSLIAEPVNWTADAQLALAIKVVAKEVGLSEDDVRARVELLSAVLPDGGLSTARPGARVGDLVRLAVDVDGVVARMLVLRDAFPRANVSAAVAKHPALLRLGRDELQESARQFRELLLAEGGSDPDALWQESPMLLEPGTLAGVLSELRRLFGASTPPGRLLQNAPDLALSCQSLASQSRGSGIMTI